MAREGIDGVGVLQKRKDVVNGLRPPGGSIVKHGNMVEMLHWQRTVHVHINIWPTV